MLKCKVYKVFNRWFVPFSDTFETGWFNFTKEMIHAMKQKSMNIYPIMYEKLQMVGNIKIQWLSFLNKQ